MPRIKAWGKNRYNENLRTERKGKKSTSSHGNKKTEKIHKGPMKLRYSSIRRGFHNRLDLPIFYSNRQGQPLCLKRVWHWTRSITGGLRVEGKGEERRDSDDEGGGGLKDGRTTL